MPRTAAAQPAPDTRQAILKVASGLLQTRGFNGFSYAHIAQALHIKTAAVHYHFASKEDLGLALIERFRDRYQRWMQASLDVPPWEKLEGFFGIYAHFLRDGQKACPVAVMQAEFQAIPPAMQQATRAMVKMIFGWLTQVLEDGRTRGAFVFEGDAAQRALLLGASMQGALLLARSNGRDAFHGVVEQVKHGLGPHGEMPW